MATLHGDRCPRAWFTESPSHRAAPSERIQSRAKPDFLRLSPNRPTREHVLERALPDPFLSWEAPQFPMVRTLPTQLEERQGCAWVCPGPGTTGHPPCKALGARPLGHITYRLPSPQFCEVCSFILTLLWLRKIK